MADTTGTLPMSDDAINQGTGKTWSEWRELLDTWGASEKSHKEIASFVSNEHGVDDWWAQGVALGYERLIGRRSVGQRADGKFSTSASKTMSAGIARHFAAWVDESQRNNWLPPGTLTLRTAQDGKSARFDDNESGGIIALWFTDKGETKSSVSIQIEGLPDKTAADARKALWKTRLNDLAVDLKG